MATILPPQIARWWTHAVREPLARVFRSPAALVDDRQIGHPGQSAPRRTGRAPRAQLGESALRIAIEIGAASSSTRRPAQRCRMSAIPFRRGRHQRRAAVFTWDQLHRFARGAKACLDLGTHRHPFHLRAKDIDEPRVTLVPAVVADRFAEKTRGDADARPIAHAMILSMPKRKDQGSLGRTFETMSKIVTRWTGSTGGLRLRAAPSSSSGRSLGPVFGFSDTWQLVINTGTTIVTFLMVFLIQRAQNKDSLAIHLKLNEIVAALHGASNRLVDVESLSEEELAHAAPVLHASWRRSADKEVDITKSHSVEEARQRHSAKHGTATAARRRIAVMADTSSFDITSTIDFQEVDNALNQARKEVGQRYDFKGAKADIDLNAAEKTLTLTTDDEMKMNALWEIVQTRLVRRGVRDQELQGRRVRAGGRRHGPPRDRDPAGHPDRGRARDREVPEGAEAEEGAGGDPGRSGARQLAVEGRPAGRHARAARARLRRRAAVRQLPIATL